MTKPLDLFPPDPTAAASDARATPPKRTESPSLSEPYRVSFVALGDAPESGPAAFGAIIKQGSLVTTWAVGTLSEGRDAISSWGQDFIRRLCWRSHSTTREHERVSFLEGSPADFQRARYLATEKLAECEWKAQSPEAALKGALARARMMQGYQYEEETPNEGERKTFKY